MSEIKTIDALLASIQKKINYLTVKIENTSVCDKTIEDLNRRHAMNYAYQDALNKIKELKKNMQAERH